MQWLSRNTCGITVPTTVNEFLPVVGKVGDVQKLLRPATSAEIQSALEQAKKLLSVQFGGYTVLEQMGGWLDVDTGELIEEKSFYVFSYGTATNGIKDMIEITAQSIKAQLGQDAVLAVVNNVAYLV